MGDAIDFAFDVYDFKGDGQVDAFYAGDLMRACNINPTLKTITEIGGQADKGKKMLSKADCYPMFKAAKDSKDQGGFHDFVEILKLYDQPRREADQGGGQEPDEGALRA